MTSRETKAPSVLRFVALRRSVTDLQRAVAFYCNGLGFEVAGNESTSGEIVVVLGAERIVLVECSSGTTTSLSRNFVVSMKPKAELLSKTTQEI